MINDLDVFNNCWHVTHIRVCERGGSIIGYEVSLFYPLSNLSIEPNLLKGYAKSLFVKDIGNINVGDRVYLCFSKKYKRFFIKR